MRHVTAPTGLNYPVVYRPWSAIAASCSVGLIMLLTAVMVLAPAAQAVTLSLPLVITGAAIAAAGVGFIYAGLATKVVLTADEIQAAGPLGDRRLARVDIRGYRVMRPSRGSPQLIMRTDGPVEKPFIVNAGILRDAACAPWFAGITDLQGEDEARQLAAIQASEALGATPQERVARAKVVRMATVGLMVAGGALLFVQAIRDDADPDVLLGFLAALPVAAAWAWYTRNMPPLSTRVTSVPNTPFSQWLALLALPAFGLLQMSFTVNLIGGQTVLLLIVAALCGLMAMSLLGKVTSTPVAGSGVIFLAAAGVTALYLYGAAVGMDAALDHAAPQLEPAQIVGKHRIGGRSTTYYLRLAASGGERDYAVRRGVYRQLEIGQTACIGAWPGALTMPWRRVIACPSTTG
jgi:hypothetical protein